MDSQSYRVTAIASAPHTQTPMKYIQHGPETNILVAQVSNTEEPLLQMSLGKLGPAH